MKRTLSFLHSAASGKVVLILFVLTNLIYATILGFSIPLVLSFAPESILFDMSPAGYSYVKRSNFCSLLALMVGTPT